MNIQKKIVQFKSLFSQLKKKQEVYQKIIELGSTLPALDKSYLKDRYLVDGCQSRTYLRSYLKDGKVFFEGTSDALISRGLLAVLIQIYSDQEPEAIVQHDTSHLKDLYLDQSLSLNRANGFAQILLKIKKEALRLLIKP